MSSKLRQGGCPCHGESQAAGFAAMALAAVLIAVFAVRVLGPLAVAAYRLAPMILAVVFGLTFVLVSVRLAFASPAARRGYPRMIWSRLRWRAHARNLGLARIDRHGRDRNGGQGKARVCHPGARFRLDSHGFTIQVRTIAGTGRREIENQADHLANLWRAERVSVMQLKPGKVIVRALRTDPLTVIGPAGLPAGVLPSPVYRPFLGTDELGQLRYLNLANQTGCTIAGLPGRGKTNLITGLLWQWSPSPAFQFALLDGRGVSVSVDYGLWLERAWIHSGDDLDAAVQLLEDVHLLMRKRLARVLDLTGKRNGWHAGPSAIFPWFVLIIDEVQRFTDLTAVKGDRRAEELVRRCQGLITAIVRQSRTAMMLVIPASQKITTDTLPSSIAANSGLAACFGVRTVEAAVASLGADIRDFPSLSPVGLQDDRFTGACTVTLRTGLSPYTRLRIPEYPDDLVAVRAAETACLRRDPLVLLEPSLELVA